ncbi:MAG: SigE family RNA polymerase sigma factor [Actinomycetota bacterium]|nr:SigE family RNA polymerase sigma factor [Actinomycetota bacterium]
MDHTRGAATLAPLGEDVMASARADSPSFEEFAYAASSRSYGTAYLLTRDHGLAEDLLQTSLVKTWEAWSRIAMDPHLYLRKVMVNTQATWWRRKWRGEKPTEELPERPGRTDVEPADRLDLWEAIGRLPTRQRAVIVLRYFDDLSEAQTAQVLGVSPGTVKSQTSRGLDKLRIDPAFAGTGLEEERS